LPQSGIYLFFMIKYAWDSSKRLFTMITVSFCMRIKKMVARNRFWQTLSRNGSGTDSRSK